MGIQQSILGLQKRFFMQTQNNTTENNEFHAVEFMRRVRHEMNEKFLNDKQKYLEYLKQAMENFKIQQKKVLIPSAEADGNR